MEWITQISWVDFIIVIILLRNAYIGSQRGLFGELFHILGICLVVILSTHFYTPAAIFLNKYLFIPINFSYLTAFIIITGILFLLFKFVCAIVRKLVKIEVFPVVNKIGGPLLGLAKGAVLSAFLCFVLLLVPIKYITNSVTEKSLFAPFFVNSGVILYKKALGIFTGGKIKVPEHILSGVPALKFKEPEMKRKDKIEELLK